jgi:hypothetical protein
MEPFTPIGPLSRAPKRLAARRMVIFSVTIAICALIAHWWVPESRRSWLVRSRWTSSATGGGAA